MTIARKLILCITCTQICYLHAFADNLSTNDKVDSANEEFAITNDSRIKTYIYNENEVFSLPLHQGFQSHIKFEKGESIKTIALGDSYAWKITPMDNLLFIRPLEENIVTNMTVISTKRMYQFEIFSQRFNPSDDEQNLVYQLKFYYPRT